MYLSFIGIALAFVYLIGRGPQPVLNHPWGFVLRDGSFAALLALASVPLGFRLGGLFSRAEYALKPRLRLYYTGASGMTLLCLAAAVWGTLVLG